MSLVHNGTTLFSGNTHSDIVENPYDFPVEFGQWFGLIGEANIIGGSKGRDIFCRVYADGYASQGAFTTALTALQSLTNTPLYGDLVVTHASTSAVTYSYCRLDHVDKEPGGIMYEPVSASYAATILSRRKLAELSPASSLTS